MDKELMKKWIEALRSGKYQQGMRRLKTHDNKFCCLGVLCDISETGKWKVSSFGENSFVDDSYGDTNVYMPPFEALTKVGLDYEDASELATKNDTQEHTFEEIAEILECILFFEE